MTNEKKIIIELVNGKYHINGKVFEEANLEERESLNRFFKEIKNNNNNQNNNSDE